MFDDDDDDVPHGADDDAPTGCVIAMLVGLAVWAGATMLVAFAL